MTPTRGRRGGRGAGAAGGVLLHARACAPISGRAGGWSRQRGSSGERRTPLSLCRSVRTSLMTALVLPPYRMRARFASSTSLGPRFSSTRLPRLVRGLTSAACCGSAAGGRAGGAIAGAPGGGRGRAGGGGGPAEGVRRRPRRGGGWRCAQAARRLVHCNVAAAANTQRIKSLSLFSRIRGCGRALKRVDCTLCRDARSWRLCYTCVTVVGKPQFIVQYLYGMVRDTRLHAPAV
jgi:hypothetical protein